jgi:hypothetical protein
LPCWFRVVLRVQRRALKIIILRMTIKLCVNEDA